MYDGQIIPDHGPMTSSSNYLCQTLSSVARQIVGRPILTTENGRGVGRLIGARPKYLAPWVYFITLRNVITPYELA